MSDLAFIIDTNSIKEATRRLDEFKLATAKMVATVINETKKLDNAANASASVQENAQERVFGAAATADQDAWVVAARRKISLMQRSADEAERASEQEARAARDLSREKDNLTNKYNPLLAAQQRYERSVVEINRAQVLGILTLRQMEAALENLTLEQARSNTVMNNGVSIWSTSAKGQSRFGAISQQVGYQVGDFAIQVQSGQSALVAFAQQGTQLAGLIPGLAGAIIGIGLSVTTAIIGPFLRGKNEAVKFEEAISDLKAAMDGLDSVTSTLNAGLEAQALGFSGLTKEAREYLEIIKGIREVALQDSIDAAISSFGDSKGNTLSDANSSQFSQVPWYQMIGFGGSSPSSQDQLPFDFMGLGIDQAKELEEILNSIAGTTTQSLIESFKAATLEIERQGLLTEDVGRALDDTAEKWGITEELNKSITDQLRAQQEATLDINTAAAERAVFISDELSSMNQQLELQRVANAQGEESYAYRQAEFEVNQSNYRVELLRQGVTGDILIKLLDIHAALLRAEQAGISNRDAAVAMASAMGLAWTNISGANGVAVSLASNIWSAANGAYAFAQNIVAAQTRQAQGYALYGNLRSQTPEFPPTPEFGGVSPPDRPMDLGIPNLVPSGGGGGSSGGGGGSAARDPLAELRKQIALETELLGINEDLAKVIKALGDDRANYSTAEITAITAEVEALRLKQEQLQKMQDDQNELAKTLESSFTDFFSSIVDGTKTAEEAFKDMAKKIIAHLLDVLVYQQLVGSFNGATGQGSGIVGTLMGALTGGGATSIVGAFGGGRALGGPVNKGSSYMVGENGPEMFSPMSSGSISPNGAMGGQTVVQNINFQVSANGDDSVRRIVAQQAPALVKAAKAGVIDARRRGIGGFRQTFN